MDLPQMIGDVAVSFGVDPRLAIELAIHESGLNQNARGTAGEVGIFQLMPATAAELGVDPYDLGQNIRGGVLYLRQQLNRFRDFARALAAYNCGPRCVSDAVATHGAQWLTGVPASTRAYVAAIMDKMGTAWTVAPGVPVPDPASLVNRVAAVTPETWKKIALLAGAGLLLYFGARTLAEEN